MHPCCLVELLQSSLHRRDVADDAVFGEVWYHLLEGWYGVFHCHGVDDELWLELAYLLQFGEAQRVVCEAQSSGVFLEYRCLVLEAEQVEEEASHLSCS